MTWTLEAFKARHQHGHAAAMAKMWEVDTIAALYHTSLLSRPDPMSLLSNLDLHAASSAAGFLAFFVS